jgi:hypothetical protein
MGGRVKTLIEVPDGRILGIDRRRMYERPFALLTNPPANAVAITANQSSAQVSLSVAGAGPLEITGLAAKRTGAALVSLMVQDGRTQRIIMSGAVHIDTIFGNATLAGSNGFLPYKLPETLFVDELRSLIAQFTDISGSDNTVYPALHGVRYTKLQNDPRLIRMRQRMAQREYMSLPFWYTFDSRSNVVLTALASGSYPITIGNDHHFDLQTITAVSTGAFSLNLVDSATGESIIDAPSGNNYGVSSELMIGNASYPFKLHEPILFLSSQKLIATITDLSNSGNTIYLTFGGSAIANRQWR